MSSEQPPIDVEFFLDPVCPWCWLTSRWVTNVQAEKSYAVGWRFISLYVLNEDKEPSEEMRQAHLGGLRCLRVLDQVRKDHGNDAVAALYTELGRRIHVERRRDELAGDTESFIAEALTAAGLDPVLAKHAHDDSHDAPLREEVVTGDAEVREIFRVPRIGAIAGCYVQNGVITRGSKVRFLRDGTIIWKGTITSLKRFKDDTTEVRAGFECGIGLSDFQDLKPGDVIETFDEVEIPRS